MRYVLPGGGLGEVIPASVPARRAEPGTGAEEKTRTNLRDQALTPRQRSNILNQVSGRIHVVMEDGTEFDLGPGDVSVLPSGHDAWVVGDEPVVLVDWFGASNYAKP
jgi:hypothetical protein